MAEIEDMEALVEDFRKNAQNDLLYLEIEQMEVQACEAACIRRDCIPLRMEEDCPCGRQRKATENIAEFIRRTHRRGNA